MKDFTTKSTFIKNFLTLVLLLDVVKNNRILPHDPPLFEQVSGISPCDTLQFRILQSKQLGRSCLLLHLISFMGYVLDNARSEE
jgi:hypothetical protein